MFYKTGVDIANTKSMWNFLKGHFTYYTLNSWNRQSSIAHNVKLYNLGLEGDWTVAMKYLFDEADAGFLQMYIEDEIKDFEEKYPYYRVCFNGRSGGYLVLYNRDNNCSVLPEFVANYDNYEDFKEEVMSGWLGNCYCSRVSDYKDELRQVVEVVRAFDRLCDSLRDLVNEYSKRSFDVDKLEQAVDRFDDEYFSDLSKLELTGPCMEGDRVRLNDIAFYNTFMQCFIRCLGEDYKRIATDSEDKYLWLKEN